MVDYNNVILFYFIYFFYFIYNIYFFTPITDVNAPWRVENQCCACAAVAMALSKPGPHPIPIPTLSQSTLNHDPLFGHF